MFLFCERKEDNIRDVFVFWEEGRQQSLCFCILIGRKATFFVFLYSDREEVNILYVFVFW